MPESYSNEEPPYHRDEIFSQLQVPPGMPFFVRLDGRRFKPPSGDKQVTYWKVKGNWNLSLFSSEDSQTLIQRILKWGRSD